VTTRRRSQGQVRVQAARDDARGMAEWNSIYQTYNAIFKLTELALLPHNLSLPQLHLLGVLQRGGGILTTGEVGREMVKASQTITGLVDRLEVQGFVERQFDRRDRRKTWVRITDSGSAKLTEARPVAERIAEELSGVLTDKELADLQAKIEKLREAAIKRLNKALTRP
jgi:MarR family 2-MHQ and catechol resistance regulon transcriptional repressor